MARLHDSGARGLERPLDDGVVRAFHDRGPARGRDVLNTHVPGWIFLAIVLSLVPHDMMYGPRAALIAECFTGRLRYSGASLGYQLASIIAGGPAPLIATALFARYRSGTAIAVFIAICAVISIVATALLKDYTNQNISHEYGTDRRDVAA
jgi:hypothetical protein